MYEDITIENVLLVIILKLGKKGLCSSGTDLYLYNWR